MIIIMCAFTITICNNNDTAQLHIKRMHGDYKMKNSQKRNFHDVHWRRQTVGKKEKWIWGFNTNKKNIQPGNRVEIKHRKMCHTNNEKQKKNNARRKGKLQVLKNIDCSVGWGCRIHRLHLCKGARPRPNECPVYDTKQSDGEVPAVLELWGMQSTPSLPLLPGPLWPGVVAPDRALSIG